MTTNNVTRQLLTVIKRLLEMDMRGQELQCLMEHSDHGVDLLEDCKAAVAAAEQAQQVPPATICTSCARANVDCPVYPQQAATCAEYRGPATWPEDASDYGSRIAAIGQNGNDGLHYPQRAEPINQRLLALVKSFGHKAGCAKNAFGEHCTCGVDEAIAVAEQAQQAERECSCGWRGPVDNCVWCGSVGPLCPECRETTEEAEQAQRADIAYPISQQAEPVARDLWMEFGKEVKRACVKAWGAADEAYEGNAIEECDISAIADRYAAQPPAVAVPDGWRDAAATALRFIEANAGHDQLCEIFDLDDDGRHKGCTCGMEDAVKKLRAMLSAAPQKDPRQAFAEYHLGKPFSASPQATAEESSVVQAMAGFLLLATIQSNPATTLNP